MAEMQEPTSSNPSTPVVLNNNAGVPPTPHAPSVGGPTGTEPTTPPQQLGGVDPTKLPPELQQLYRSMQGDYTRKTQEISEKEKSWETERQKYGTLEKQFADLSKRVQYYANQEQVWNQWKPLLQGISQKGILDQVQALVEGRPVQGAQQPAARPSGEATAQRLLGNIADDDYVNGAMLNQALQSLQERMVADVQGTSSKQMETYARQAVKEIMEYVNNYQTLADQMAELRLLHQYGLAPKEGATFDPRKVVETAREYSLTDLNAAYQLAYGRDEASRLAAAATAQAAADTQRLEREAYERGKREAENALRNSQNGFLPGPGATLPEFKPTKATSYRDAERALSEKLSAMGIRQQ